MDTTLFAEQYLQGRKSWCPSLCLHTYVDWGGEGTLQPCDSRDLKPNQPVVQFAVLL